jgi:hypothetical protein
MTPSHLIITWRINATSLLRTPTWLVAWRLNFCKSLSQLFVTIVTARCVCLCVTLCAFLWLCMYDVVGVKPACIT